MNRMFQFFVRQPDAGNVIGNKARVTPNQLLAASVVMTIATALALVGAYSNSRDFFTVAVLSSAYMFHLVLGYMAIRMMTLMPVAKWRLFATVIISAIGLSLWAWAIYFMVHLKYA